jgi:hypothetical protein
MFRKYPETGSSLEQTSLRCLKFPQVLHSESLPRYLLIKVPHKSPKASLTDFHLIRIL